MSSSPDKRGSFDPLKFYREYPTGGNEKRGDWLRRCLTSMIEASRSQELPNTHRDGGREEPLTPAKSCSEGVEAGSAPSHVAQNDATPQGDSAGESRSTLERAQGGQFAGNDAADKGKCGDSSVSRSAEHEPARVAPIFTPSNVAPKMKDALKMLDEISDDGVAFTSSTTPQKPEAWAYAVPQPKGAEFDYLVFPDYGEAESHVTDADDEFEREIIPLVPASALSAIARTVPLVTDADIVAAYAEGSAAHFKECHGCGGGAHVAGLREVMRRADGGKQTP